MFHVPEKFRVKSGPNRSDKSYGNCGAFRVHSRQLEKSLNVIASDGMGWEHVSVSLPKRCPTWFEMCFIKDLFWDAEDLVVQFHPPASEYVNTHCYTLHLWRYSGGVPFCIRPPKVLVG